MVFLSAWNSVMSPAHTDIILQSGGHIVNAHRVVLAPKPHVMQKKLKGNLDRIGTAPMEMQKVWRWIFTTHSRAKHCKACYQRDSSQHLGTGCRSRFRDYKTLCATYSCEGCTRHSKTRRIPNIPVPEGPRTSHWAIRKPHWKDELIYKTA
ncbi:uncharacterized protein [Physcomitrium patens]|uniref:uncharacterized protein isoform X2 n=1 Tax=Physcomitrium patens TaxID=3218 RepID=UPI003CCDDB00